MRKLGFLAMFALVGMTFSARLMAQYSQPVRDVENPARTAFWGSGNGTFAVNTEILVLDLYAVPAGQRLVMEYVSVTCSTDADDELTEVLIEANKYSAGSGTHYYISIPMQKRAVNLAGKMRWVGSQTVRAYADALPAGAMHKAHFHHNKLASTPYCTATVFGHTITR